MNQKFSKSVTFACMGIVYISSAQAEQSITGITSDLGGFWQTSESAPSLVAADTMHNLTSVTANGVTISTGVDDATLSANGVVFTPGEFRAFIPVTAQSNDAGQGANDDNDGGWGGPVYPIIDNDVTPYMTDGINGLGLSTFANNMDATLDFFFYALDTDHVGDGRIDFIYFNSAAARSAEIVFTLLDGNDNVLGTPVGSPENAHPDIANLSNDRFSTTPPYPSNAVASSQELEGFGVELSEFGLSNQQLQNARKIRVELPQYADPPFVAYNSLAMLACATGDDDNDGICNLVEGTADSDGDGTPANRDTDSDGDGVADSIEGIADTDADGTANYLDLDSDADGISDALEGNVDTDGDNIPDYLDSDSDNDGLPDYIEGNTDTDSDGKADFRDTDSDGDTVIDSAEGVLDDRALSGIDDASIDNETSVTWTAVMEDCPVGYVPTGSSQFAVDIGWNNAIGSVGSTILNIVLNDTAYAEMASAPDDGNIAHITAQNGGSVVNTEATMGALRMASSTFRSWTHRTVLTTAPATIDTARIDVVTAFDDFSAQNSRIINGCAVDTDNDGLADHLDSDGINTNDTDSDGDGIPDIVEGTADTDGDGTPDNLDTDSDGDGIDDSVEGPVDSDEDGIGNFRDTDSDGDGIPDADEGIIDSDSDNVPNYIDTDSDNDTILDADEGQIDTDADGLPNYIDTDSDDDSIPDATEGQVDSDNDTVPNYLDDDSDGDGVPDATETGVDTDADGIPDYLDSDSDNDGIPDSDNTDSTDTDTDTDDNDQDTNDIPTLRTGLNGAGSMETWTLLALGLPAATLARTRRRKAGRSMR